LQGNIFLLSFFYTSMKCFLELCYLTMLFGKDYTETDASVKFDLSLGGKYTDGVFVTAKFT